MGNRAVNTSIAYSGSSLWKASHRSWELLMEGMVMGS